MDLPVWQGLYASVRDTNFIPVTVALDARGPEAARPWIEGAKAEYPCLVDSAHLVGGLYGMVNVPSAVWIDEDGVMVRPPESAGTNDAFRQMDRQDFSLPAEAAASLAAQRAGYVEALRDWAYKGAASLFALDGAEVRRRLEPANDDAALAAANATMGDHLCRMGLEETAQRYFAEATRLQPENWSYRRQAWNLEHPLKSGGPEFWAAVDALGEEHYYRPNDIPPRAHG